MYLGGNLQYLRKANGNMTQEKLAEQIGVSRQTVSKWERGLLSPDITLLPKIAVLFKCSIDSLFDIDRPDGYYKFDVLQVPPDRYIVNLGTSKLVNYAHKNNIAVQYWTINDADKMAFLQDIGADAIITDSPDVGYEVLKSQDK